MNINICHKCKKISKIFFAKRRQNSYMTISSGVTNCLVKIPNGNTKIFEINFFAKERFYQTNLNENLSMKDITTFSQRQLKKKFEKIKVPEHCPYKFEHEVIDEY